MSNSAKDQLISEILSRTLDELADWEPPELMPGVGPQYPEIYFEFSNRLSAYRADVTSTLSRKSTEELKSEYLKSRGSVLNPLTMPHGVYFKLCGELQQLKKTSPPWFASGWSARGYLLDVVYWTAATTLRIEEAALMMVGVDPRKANYDVLFKAYGVDDRADEVLYFLEDYFELLVRRFGDPDNGAVSIYLAELSAWIDHTGLSVSPELQRVMKNFRIGAQSPEKGHVKADLPAGLHGRSRSMFQRVLLVVAVDKYGLRKPGDTSKVANAMVKAGDFLGFRLDKVNIAKQIRAGFHQLSDDEKGELAKKE